MAKNRLKKISNLNFLKTEYGYKSKKNHYKTKVALIYPNYYHVGMSNLGFQTVYSLLNNIESVLCERAFLPELGVYDSSNEILTIETRTSISRFDIIAFSVSFENDILAVLSILKKARLPLFSKDRSYDTPLIMAGGVLCFLNPEPLAPFIDCFLIGEAEPVLEKFFEIFDPLKHSKKKLLDMACQIPSLYVPSFFQTKYEKKGTIKSFKSIEGTPCIIEKALSHNLELNPTNTVVLTPNTVFKNTFLVEISRGCHHGCRFCSAGYIYRPPRFQSKKIIIKQIQKGSDLTDKIGLVGAAVSDHPSIKSICCKTEWDNIKFKFSSLRADKIDDKTIEIFKRSRTKTATIAPDAGSERLRRVINKNITEEDILNATKKFVLGGILNLKLYFIIGLPTETKDDIIEIVTLCKKIKSCFLQYSRQKKQIGNISLSLSPFVPKPFTPFQWFSMDKPRLLKKKINFLRKNLNKISNLNIQVEPIRKSYIQALIARGDRRISKILILSHKNNGNWPNSIKTSKINTDFYIHRERERYEIFPWDFLRNCVSKEFLLKEYQLAMNGLKSSLCGGKSRQCNSCGVCDYFN